MHVRLRLQAATVRQRWRRRRRDRLEPGGAVDLLPWVQREVPNSCGSHGEVQMAGVALCVCSCESHGNSIWSQKTKSFSWFLSFGQTPPSSIYTLLSSEDNVRSFLVLFYPSLCFLDKDVYLVKFFCVNIGGCRMQWSLKGVLLLSPSCIFLSAPQRLKGPWRESCIVPKHLVLNYRLQKPIIVGTARNFTHRVLTNFNYNLISSLACVLVTAGFV